MNCFKEFPDKYIGILSKVDQIHGMSMYEVFARCLERARNLKIKNGDYIDDLNFKVHIFVKDELFGLYYDGYEKAQDAICIRILDTFHKYINLIDSFNPNAYQPDDVIEIKQFVIPRLSNEEVGIDRCPIKMELAEIGTHMAHRRLFKL